MNGTALPSPLKRVRVHDDITQLSSVGQAPPSKRLRMDEAITPSPPTHASQRKASRLGTSDQQRSQDVPAFMVPTTPTRSAATTPLHSSQHTTTVASASEDEDIFSLFCNDTLAGTAYSHIEIVEEPTRQRSAAAWSSLRKAGPKIINRYGRAVTVEELDFDEQVAWLSVVTRGPYDSEEAIQQMPKSRSQSSVNPSARPNSEASSTHAAMVPGQNRDRNSGSVDPAGPADSNQFSHRRANATPSTSTTLPRTRPAPPRSLQGAACRVPLIAGYNIPPYTSTRHLRIQTLPHPDFPGQPHLKAYKRVHPSASIHQHPSKTRQSLAQKLADDLAWCGRSVWLACSTEKGNVGLQAQGTRASTVFGARMEGNPLVREGAWVEYRRMARRLEMERRAREAYLLAKAGGKRAGGEGAAKS